MQQSCQHFRLARRRVSLERFQKLEHNHGHSLSCMWFRLFHGSEKDFRDIFVGCWSSVQKRRIYAICESNFARKNALSEGAPQTSCSQ